MLLKMHEREQTASMPAGSNIIVVLYHLSIFCCSCYYYRVVSSLEAAARYIFYYRLHLVLRYTHNLMMQLGMHFFCQTFHAQVKKSNKCWKFDIGAWRNKLLERKNA